jgi:integrase
MRPIDREAEIERLRTERAKFTESNLSPLTISGYSYDWAMFKAWCEGMRLSSLPATAETVSLYLTWLLDQGKKITTARRRNCAIVHFHRLAGCESPVNEEIQELLRGAQRLLLEKPRQMRPLSLVQLRQISSLLHEEGTARAMRDRALLMVGFASALRRSNLATLRMEDVDLVDEGLILSIGREKQDQEGKGRLIGIPKGTGVHTCPVRCLAEWVSIRGGEPGPLFPRLNNAHKGQAMDGECVHRVVHRCVRMIGLDPTDRYGGHSLRAGFITAAGEAGVGELLIAAQSGHKNLEMVRRYFRRTHLFRSNACATLGM